MEDVRVSASISPGRTSVRALSPKPDDGPECCISALRIPSGPAADPPASPRREPLHAIPMSVTADAETLSPDRLEARVRELGPWFHNLDLKGVKTAPDHFLGDYPNFKFRNFAHVIPRDLTGKTVLDIGCNAGFYSMEMKRRGASRVV